MKSLDQINKILFQADLLNTSCVANDATDEYKHIAQDLYNLMALNNNFCEGMLEYVLSESLSIEEDELAKYVTLSQVELVFKEILTYINNLK